jgi:hypothetical protein
VVSAESSENTPSCRASHNGRFSFPLVAARWLRYSNLVTREKLKTLLSEYGNVALVTYLVIWVLTLAGFAVAISMGIKVEGATSGAGLAGATWLATKLTQPLRIAATLALTPFVAALHRKLRGMPPLPSDKPSDKPSL